jgi:hypothetical protein
MPGSAGTVTVYPPSSSSGSSRTVYSYWRLVVMAGTVDGD